MKTEKDELAAAWITRISGYWADSLNWTPEGAERSKRKALRALGGEGAMRVFKEYMRQVEHSEVPSIELWLESWTGVAELLGAWLEREPSYAEDLMGHAETPRQLAALVGIANSIAWHGGKPPSWWNVELASRLMSDDVLAYVLEIGAEQLAEKWGDELSVKLLEEVKRRGIAPKSMWD